MPDRDPYPPPETVDLSNCDREPIHVPGRVQDYGCLIAVSSDWMIKHASMNCGDMLGHPAEALIGTRFVDLLPEQTVHDLRTRMQALGQQQTLARAFAYPVFGDERLFDVCIHESDRNIVFEFEPRTDATRRPDDAGTVQALIARVQRHDKVEKMAMEAARGLKLLCGFDRVMVYRFEADDSGTVIAEAAERDMEPFLGLRYPASDIPKQARALYTRNLLRIIADVDAPTHEIYPVLDPTGAPLDMSLAVTRAVSPIHLEYLRNMEVGASMSVSILRKGKLWGLFACHHRTPRYLDNERRSTIELFAQLFNYQLAQIELDAELADVDRARDLHDRLMAQLSSGQSLVDLFDSFADSIFEVIPYDGAAIYSDGYYRAIGKAPTEEEFLGLARFLNTTPPAQIYATDHLVGVHPKAEAFADRVAGLMALPISRTPRDYLVVFREEVARSVTWAGNPEKPVEPGPNGLRLTPRKSFEAWRETVHNRSIPWTAAEIRAADALRVTLLEVVLKLADENNAERKRAQDQQELLIAELNHRVRNILGLIRGLVSRGKDDAGTLEDYRAVLDSRIDALARAHDQLTQTGWNWVSLRALIDTEVQAFLAGRSDRVAVSGEEIELSPTAFTTLALVIHELVTNSAKYGSLADSSGSVAIDIGLKPDGVAALRWREIGGPPVQAPTRKGFGTTIIERSIPFELKGRADTRFHVTGFEGDFELPSTHVRRARDGVRPQASRAPVETGSSHLSGRAIVLEDNMIIAMDAVDMLTQLGADRVETASRVSDALKMLEDGAVEFALVDVNLGDESSLAFVQKCFDDGIPVLLATGYGGASDLIANFPPVPIIKKPYTLETLRAALADGAGS